jgi:hypothetical protein
MTGYLKLITYFGKKVAVACDGNCAKAWGINSRPRVQLSVNPDDYEFKSDGELGDAPVDPGTYEGGVAKPEPNDPDKLNKWCVRECERCNWYGELEQEKRQRTVVFRDFSRRVRNIGTVQE